VFVFYRCKLNEVRSVLFLIVPSLRSVHLIKYMPYIRPIQKPVCVVDVNTVCILLRHLQFMSRIKLISLLCLIVSRVQQVLCWAETLAPLKQKSAHSNVSRFYRNPHNCSNVRDTERDVM